MSEREYRIGTDDIWESGDISAENALASAWNATVDAAKKYSERERRKLKQNKALMEWAKKKRREKKEIEKLRPLARYELEITFEGDNKLTKGK